MLKWLKHPNSVIGIGEWILLAILVFKVFWPKLNPCWIFLHLSIFFDIILKFWHWLTRFTVSFFIVWSTVELLTPQHWYNTSAEAPAGSVIKGQSFNITCSTLQQYPGGSFQLRLIRSNGTVRQTLPALTPSVTFTFPNAQSSNEGYYYCLYRVQLGGRTFVSRESQPLPIAIRGETLCCMSI